MSPRPRYEPTLPLGGWPTCYASRTAIRVHESLSLSDLEGDTAIVLKSLQERFEGFRDGRFEVEYSDGEYGEDHLIFSGWRDPTPEEQEKIDALWVKEDARKVKEKERNKKAAAKAKERREADERKQYERLSKKYGDG